jgi:hypothetical protein
MEYRVVIPEEVFGILQWEEEGLPAICVVNQALANFEPKVVFGWHLSMIIDSQEDAGNGMPMPHEKEVLDHFGDDLDKHLKANGTALFLARITWNGTRQLLYRVYDPEAANDYLMGIIKAKSQMRPFEFRMEHDEAWKYARYFLKHWEAEHSYGLFCQDTDDARGR